MLSSLRNLFPFYWFIIGCWPILGQAENTIISVAGDGSAKYSGDGQEAAKAQLNSPTGVILDGQGNLYFADTGNQVIRQIQLKDNKIVTFAGQGEKSGYDGDKGPATEALLKQPTGIAIDAKGNFYIADTGNQVIRQIDSGGKITTLVGAGDGGSAPQVQLKNPRGIVVDNAGNLYIADTGNQVIRKVQNIYDADPSKRVITTVVGGGNKDPLTEKTTATQVKLNSPTAVALRGNVLYIADSANKLVLKVEEVDNSDPAKQLTSILAGGGTSGPNDGGLATAAQLSEPYDVAVDSQGNVYIADRGDNLIRQVTVQGLIVTVAGGGNVPGDGGPATAAQLNKPEGLAVAGQALYIADTGQHRLRKVTFQSDTGGASFEVTVTLSGTGHGVVTAPPGTGTGIRCNQSFCSTDKYLANSSVTLTAVPEKDSSFGGWGGSCSGNETTVTVTMTAAKTCTAHFELIPPPSPLAFIEAQKNGVNGVAGLDGVTSVAMSPDGQYVYATGFKDNAVAIFNRDPGTGRLTFNQLIKEGLNNVTNLQGPNAVSVSPDNKNVYVTGSKSDSIVVFNQDLSLIQFQKNGIGGVAGIGGVSSLAISPDGQRVYVTGTRDNALVVFARNESSGLLNFLQAQNGLGGVSSVAVTHAVNPPYDIYVAAENTVVAFRRDPAGGELTSVGTYPLGEGTLGVYGIIVSPDDQHVYVAREGALVAFKREPATGNLSLLDTYLGKVSGILGFSGTPLAISLDGERLYVTSVNDDALTVFDRNPQTGGLTASRPITDQLDGVFTLDGAMGVAVSPDGTQVYTAALQSAAISLFSTSATDLEVTVSAPSAVSINSSLTYLITVTNRGGEAAGDAQLTDTLPAEVTFSSVTATHGTCTPPAVGKVVCQLGNLEKGASVTVTLKVTTPPTVVVKEFTNVAQISSGLDTTAANNTVSTLTTLAESVPTADLVTQVTTDPASDSVGTNMSLTYLVKVTNQGSVMANGVELTNSLPAGVTFNAQASDQRCQLALDKLNTVICQLAQIQANGSSEAKLVVTTPATATSLNFTTNVKGLEVDPQLDNNQASKITTVGATVNIDLEVVDALADPNTLSITSEQKVVYQVKVKNKSDLEANGVMLTGEPWPTKQLQYLSDTGGCSLTDHLECPLGKLAPQATKVVNVQAKALEPSQDLKIKFTVSSPFPDPLPADNEKTATLNISGQVANLSVTLTASTGGNAAAVNQAIDYTVTVNNSGPSATTVILAIDFQLAKSDVVIEDVTAVKGTCSPGQSSASLQCQLEAIPANEGGVVTIKATPKGAGTLKITATASVPKDTVDPLDNNTATKETAISETAADLAVALTATPIPVLKNSDLTLEATVINKGPEDATGVLVTFTLPSQFTFKSAEGNQLAGECTVASGNVVKCPLNPISQDSKEEFIVRIVTTPGESGSFEASATVTSEVFDPSLVNNTAALTKNSGQSIEVTQKIANVGIQLEETPKEPVVGNFITYTMSVTNAGPDEATNLTLVDSLPTQVTLVKPVLSPDGVCYDINTSTQTITCTLAKLPTGSTATLTLKLQPLVAGELTNSITLQAAEFDPEASNNTASVKSYVNNPATLFFVGAQKNGANGVQGLKGVMALALSPDGNHLYAAGFGDNALTVFSRNPSNGQLSFVQALFDGTDNVDGLQAASDVAVSPDGSFVYATALNDSAVSVFQREALTGKLTWVEVQKNGLNGVKGLGGAFALQVTAEHVYVAGSNDDAIVVLGRDKTTGKLSLVETQTLPSLDGVNALTVSPDGLQLFATSINSGSLTIFNREPTSGRLSFLKAFLKEEVPGLGGASGVVVSPNGQQIYVSSAGTDNAILAFKREGPTFSQILHNGDQGIKGLTGATAVTMSSDYVYVAGMNDNAVTVFKPAGEELTFLDVIVRDNQLDGNGLGGAHDVVVGPTGAQIYVAGFGDNAISVFRMANSDLKVTLTGSQEVAKVAETFAYRIQVTNNGPNPATHVVIEDVLSDLIQLVEIQSEHRCTHTFEHKVICYVELLEVNQSAEVTLQVAANNVGEVQSQVAVTADQFDPSPATAEETTQISATADLAISMLANPSQVIIGSELTYQMTVTNQGPDPAQNVQVVDKLPSLVNFSAAKVDALTDRCQRVLTEVTCTLGTLAPLQQSVVTLVVVPTQAGKLTNEAAVNSQAVDSNLPNSSATQTTEVLPNLIEDTRNNGGHELRDYTITATGAVIGGALAGTITNQGLLTDVHILPNTLVTGGGKLSGTIFQEGLIENAQLLSGTVINGGTLRGEITGFPSNPATLNSRIEAGSSLSQVILAVGSEVDPTVVLGAGVRFIANTTIPPGIDLRGALPTLTEPVSEREAIDLTYDVLVNGESLLAAINALPDLKNNNLAFVQRQPSGNLLLPVGEEVFVLIPVSVRQASAGATPGVLINPDGSVIFITETRREVLVQPSIQAYQAFQDALKVFGLGEFTANPDGNLSLVAGHQSYFQTRPDWQTQVTSPFEELGFQALPSPLIKGSQIFLLRFVDETGVRRQQFFYPAGAHQAELQTALRGIPGATTVTFENNGTVSVKVDNRTYQGVFDYRVTTGPASKVTQLLMVPDQNGDGNEDLKVVYANGDQQRLFLVPFPALAEAIQAIPEVQNAKYLVSQTVDGHLMLMQLLKRLLLKVTHTTQVAEPPSMTLYPDGSGLFVTAAGQQVRVQPLVQDLTGLQTVLRSVGLAGVLAEGNGNLTIPFNASLSYSARPEVESNFAWLTMPLGLHPVPTSLPGVVSLMYVFRDETGNKRQQFIYPAAKEPQNLYTFFSNMPGITRVVFDDKGMVTADGKDGFRGIFDYAVTTGQVPTGGIQFTRVPDINGDQVEDFAVTYGNGSRQVIYQVP